jgi:F0F1-type ATP synthase assembly protein I
MRKLTLWQAVAISTQFGFLLAASVLIGLGLGMVVDSWTHVGPIAYLVGALLGMGSGVYSVIKLVNTFLRKKPPAADKSSPRRD